MGVVSDKKSFMDGLRAAVGEQERRFSSKVKGVVTTFHYTVTEFTPVWTGQALANYQWSVGSPLDGEPLAARGSGPTGSTNDMPLGPEPRRAENQEAADESLKALDFRNPYRVFYCNNNDPTIGGLEAGQLPYPPFRQRSPNGMFRQAIVHVDALLEMGRL